MMTNFADQFQTSSSPVERLTILVFIAAIVIGNVCVFVTYFIRTKGTHWTQIFILAMSFIDLFIGSFVLPMRFMSAYSGQSMTSHLCIALVIGENCAMAAVLYAIGLLNCVRIYEIFGRTSSTITKRSLIVIIILLSWIIFFLFYGIPYMTNYSNYLRTTSSNNITHYCVSYMTSIYHPKWMEIIEVIVIFGIPILLTLTSIAYLTRLLCKPRPKFQKTEKIEKKKYQEYVQITWHVYILSFTFLSLWLPWIILKITLFFIYTYPIQQALQITYYILIFKCVLFPLIYAATNPSFRGTFAIYKHRRVLMSN
ncbi:unnamed protein product [Didymodactylos carnosus]|uniref:G-protein coupled receptors family 1 profile domain-containing protein n=1 Tax=Didymodactylos carnosus TaxID=1234261 RepID=A0A815HN19_9BILA|nr:unnamed protein product [Didymodactylos carnosus]CAF1353829.1 unnamed protein product [Didymodactylos carnosus]CAF4007201.1 unnamed protein product [Didymodactylos carnosus]CAF4226190.1 unnamed protein product [Didymodactylos carnosus]